MNNQNFEKIIRNLVVWKLFIIFVPVKYNVKLNNNSNNMELYKFGAPWCNACKKQSNIFKSGNLNIEYKEFDVEDEPELVEQYVIKSLPTCVLVDEDCNELYRWVGTVSCDEINKIVESFMP